MVWKALKPLRLIISLFFFVWVVSLFLDNWTDWSVNEGNAVLEWQFVPSLLKFISSYALIHSGFLVIALFTLVFGRVYCSSLCPLGTLMDIVYCARNVFSRRKRKFLRFTRSRRTLRYSLLGLTLVLLLFGNLSLLLFLDPYSYFGRISTLIFRPAINRLFDEGVYVMQYYGIYAVSPLEKHFFANPSFYIALILFIAIGLISFFRGRWYCNVLCPVGAVLGLLSRFSVFQIRIRESACTRCGSCVKNCKAQCIDLQKLDIDPERCVACQNCISVCPEGGIRYGNRFRSGGSAVQPLVAGSSRRDFLLQTMTGAGLLTVSAVQAVTLHNEQDAPWLPRRKAISPPGSFGREYFTEHCTACGLCISQCPTQVLQPALMEYGLSGFLQPHLDFTAGFCNYECTVCSHVCPTGAILPLKKDEKKRTQIGIARFIEEKCIVVTKGTQCGACSEHCPTKACDMVLYKNNLNIPFIEPDRCIGCGACEHICPTFPKSIVVDENIFHLTAKKSKKSKKSYKPEKQADTNKNPAEEFPF